MTNLQNYTLTYEKDRSGQINEAVVYGVIENTVDRQIDIIITAEFYDKDDVYIGDNFFKILGLRSKVNSNIGYSTSFSISYLEKGVQNVDHVKIHAEEIVRE